MSFPSRFEILNQYRAFFRVARRMPTVNRRRHIENKARKEFRENSSADLPQDRIQFLYRLGETLLDQAIEQANHLNLIEETYGKKII